MKFIIDSFPKNPKECLFSKRNCEYGYICGLNKKECCISKCDFLLEGDKVNSEKISAHWEPNDKGEYYCTNCGNECDFDLFCKPLLNQFCGNCGAEMG